MAPVDQGDLVVETAASVVHRPEKVAQAVPAPKSRVMLRKKKACN